MLTYEVQCPVCYMVSRRMSHDDPHCMYCGGTGLLRELAFRPFRDYIRLTAQDELNHKRSLDCAAEKLAIFIKEGALYLPPYCHDDWEYIYKKANVLARAKDLARKG